MEVFHISKEQYERGQIVDIKNFGEETFYHRNLTENQRNIDNYLSVGKPDGYPERKLCIYAFAKPEYCVYFQMKNICKGGNWYLYRCNMDVFSGHPMFLVGEMEKTGPDRWEVLRNEYWYPNKKWKLLEYLSDKIEIVEEIKVSERLMGLAMTNGASDYADDSQIVRTLFLCGNNEL